MPLATPEPQVERELAQYEQDLAWVLENYDALIKEYGGEFLAVLEGKVLGHCPQIEGLCKELKSKYGENSHRVVIEFIYKEHPNLVLGV